jgi:hypothetical protein
LCIFELCAHLIELALHCLIAKADYPYMYMIVMHAVLQCQGVWYQDFPVKCEALNSLHRGVNEQFGPVLVDYLRCTAAVPHSKHPRKPAAMPAQADLDQRLVDTPQELKGERNCCSHFVEVLKLAR